MRRTRVRVALAAGGLAALAASAPAGALSNKPAVSPSTPLASPAGSLPTGPRANGTAVLPDGRFVTPAGRTIKVDLLPLNLLVSRDHRRLYVSSEGGDDAPDKPGAKNPVYNRFLTVLDTKTLSRRRVKDDALQYGLAESADGRELYVSEGESGKVGVFDTATMKRKTGIALDPQAFPWGMDVPAGGRYAYVVGFRGNTLSAIDTRTHAVTATVATGQYPYTVAVAPDGRTAWVSNWGLYNAAADAVAGRLGLPFSPPPATLGGYNTDASSSIWQYDLADPAHPTVVRKVRLGHPIDGYDVIAGAAPSSMAYSPDGTTLAVTASNNDLLVLFDARTGALRRSIDLRVIAGGPTGAQPNAVSFSPDGRLLLVAEGGRNSVAVLDAGTGATLGRIPTGWYPSAVTTSSDGRQLYIASAKGLGAGPNGLAVPGDVAANNVGGNNATYIGNLLYGTVQVVDLGAACTSLQQLSTTVDRDNGLVPATHVDGSVVPAAYGSGPSKQIKHVVFILKENRTYDQLFGDVAGTERDQRLAFYGGKVSPNHHAVARQFAHGQNFYDIGQDSFDGHFVIGSGHVNEFDQKVHVTVWNANKLGPEDFYISAPENLPQGGFLWNGLYRSGISFRIYGEAAYLLGLGPTVLTPPGGPGPTGALLPQAYALRGNYDPLYPSQVTPSRPVGGPGNTDKDRADYLLRVLPGLDAAGQIPQFMFIWLNDDHTSGTSPGKPTPETMVATNDNAMGRILEGLTHTAAWDDMAIFVTEDDPQDGQDHVDAHRTIQLVLSPYVKRGYVSKVHASNYSALKTIDLLLGAPPNSIQEASASSLADYFTTRKQVTPRYTALPLEITPETNPPPSQAKNAKLREAAELSARIPPGLDQGGELLQEALRLRHEGGLAAGNPNVPLTPDVQEHHLDAGDASSVPAVELPTSAGSVRAADACAGSGGSGGAGGNGSGLPTTGGQPMAALLALLLVAVAAVLRPRRR